MAEVLNSPSQTGCNVMFGDTTRCSLREETICYHYLGLSDCTMLAFYKIWILYNNLYLPSSHIHLVLKQYLHFKARWQSSTLKLFKKLWR